MMAGHLICFGYGFSARHLIPLLLAKGWTVSATTRSENIPEVDGVEFIRFDAVVDRHLAKASHVLLSVPPGESGDPVLDRYHHLVSKASHLKWIGYLSTTGVYGDTAGAWVTEASPLNPTNRRSTLRVAAEASWLNLHQDQDLPVHIFRLAGIYGSGRSSLDQVRARRAQRIDKPGHKFSRIHAADIATVLWASINAPHPGRIYNMCDDEPAPQADVVAYACGLLGAQVPALVGFDAATETMSPMARSFWNDNRLVDNSRIKDELGVDLAYPTYRAGLSAIYSTENS